MYEIIIKRIDQVAIRYEISKTYYYFVLFFILVFVARGVKKVSCHLGNACLVE